MRGTHSKVRQMHSGRPAMPNPGYSAPAEVRGLHPSGLEMVVVHTVREINSLEPGKQGAVIASTVGDRKKLALLEAARSKQVKVLNIKDIAKHEENIKKAFEERKELRKKKRAEASKKEEEKKKKAEKKEKEEKEKKEKEAAAGDVTGNETAAEAQKEKEEEQKEIVEKTLTKRQ